MIGKFKVAALIGAAVAFVGHWVLHFAVAGALFAAIGLGGGHDHSAEAGPSCSNVQRIEAKALTDHECGSSEWHFVINQVRLGQAHAPAGITVSWASGQTQYIPLEKFTGKVAHYTTYSNLSSTVTQAVAYIYSGWGGQFNLSHGPCGPMTTSTPMPTPVATPTPTPTPVDTVTPVDTSISQMPVGFPNTGSAPAVECDDGDASHTKIALAVVLGVGATMAIVFIANYLRR